MRLKSIYLIILLTNCYSYTIKQFPLPVSQATFDEEKILYFALSSNIRADIAEELTLNINNIRKKKKINATICNVQNDEIDEEKSNSYTIYLDYQPTQTRFIGSNFSVYTLGIVPYWKKYHVSYFYEVYQGRRCKLLYRGSWPTKSLRTYRYPVQEAIYSGWIFMPFIIKKYFFEDNSKNDIIAAKNTTLFFIRDMNLFIRKRPR